MRRLNICFSFLRLLRGWLSPVSLATLGGPPTLLSPATLRGESGCTVRAWPRLRRTMRLKADGLAGEVPSASTLSEEWGFTA